MKQLILIFLLSLVNPLAAIVIGSDSTVSRQARAFFDKGSSLSNTMKGFSVFQNGFVLENPSTKALFDAFFPISGDVVLNGGELVLDGDLEFKSPFRVGVGKINGNGYAVELPRNVSILDFPSLYYIKLIVNLVDQIDVGHEVYSIDWNYDDRYVAVALRGRSGNSELKILYFDGAVLNEVASQDFGTVNLNAVRWHPMADYVATGGASGIELKTWYFNRSNNTLTQIDSLDIGNVNAVSWSSTGAHLAVGKYSDNDLFLYPVANGIIGSGITGTFGRTLQVQPNAIDWDYTNHYIAVGTKRATGDELFIFYFNGTTLVKQSSIELNSDVNDVSWRPGTMSLAIGLARSNETIQLFEYSTTSQLLQVITSAYVHSTGVILGGGWDSTGRYLAVSKQYASNGYELEVYYYDDTDNTLHLVSGYSSDAHNRDVAWSHNGNYLISGDDNSQAFVFNFTNVPFVFKDLKLFLGSETHANASVYFEGNCVLNGRGNIFDLQSTASMIIMPNTSLMLEDITIKGIAHQNIQCMDESSKIILHNVTWVQDSDTTFTLGSMVFSDEVRLRGDNAFIYESAQTSTILSKAQLILDNGFTFSYAPSNNNAHLIEFADKTSALILDGGKIYAGAMGLNLTQGKLYVNRNAVLESVATSSGITFGCGVAEKDLYCSVLSGMQLFVAGGCLNYKNSSVASWKRDNFAMLHIGTNAALNLFSVLDIGNGTVQLDQNSTIRPIGEGGLKGRIYSAGVFTYALGDL